jgi:membrane protease YdiL (CAAX protease family)
MDNQPETTLDRTIQLIQARPLATFSILTVAISWLLWLLPWALGLDDPIAFRHIVALGAFSPSLVGAVLTYLQAEERPAIRWDWFMLAVLVIGVLYIFCLPYASNLPATVSSFGWAARILLWAAPALVIALSLSDQGRLRRLVLPASRQSWFSGWYAAALLFIPALFGAGYLISQALGQAAPVSLTGSALEIALTITASFIYILLFGGALGEEPGLRGFVLPRLQRQFSPLVSAVLLGAAWIIWFIPLYFNGYYQSGFAGGFEAILYRGGLNLLLVIVLTWLYKRTGGNLLACILLHASYTTTSILLPPSVPAILLLVIAALGLIIQARMWQRPLDDLG